MPSFCSSSSPWYHRTQRLYALLLIGMLALGTTLATQPARAYSDLTLTIVSSATTDTPLNVELRCYSDQGAYNLVLSAQYWNGSAWATAKSQTLQSTIASLGTCANTSSGSGQTASYWYAIGMDKTWFPFTPGQSRQYKLVAELRATTGNALLVSRESALFYRAVGPVTSAFISGQSLTTNQDTTRTRTSNVTLAWSAVDGASGYDVALFDGAGGAIRSWSDVGATTLQTTLDRGDVEYTFGVYPKAPGPINIFTAGTPAQASIILDTTPPGAPSNLTWTFPAASPTMRRGYWDLDWSRPAGSGYANRAEVELTKPNGQVLLLTPPAQGADCVLATSATGSETACTGGGVGVGTLAANDPDGTYTVRLRNYDLAGNASAWSSPIALVLDTTSPAPPASMSGPAITNQQTVDLVWATVSDAASYTLVRRTPNGTISTLGTASTPAWSGANVAEGTNEFRVMATDAAGNTSTTYRAAQVVRDTVAPPKPMALDASALTNQTSASVSWGATSDTASYAVVLTTPSGQTSTRTINAPTTAAPGLPLDAGDGVYTMTVESVDAATNRSGPSAPATILLDTTPPARLDAAPSGPTLTNQRTAILTWPTIPAAVQTLLTVTGPSGGVQQITVTAPATSYDLALDQGDGDYCVTVAGQDAAGNVAQPSPALTITLDTIGPLAPAAAPVVPTRTNATTSALTWPSVDDAVAYEVWANGERYATVPSPTLVISGTDGETLAIRVRGIDAAGNQGAFTPPATTTFDRTAPEVTISFAGAPDGSGADLRWTTEAGATAQLLRSFADGHEQTMPTPTSPTFFPAAFGETVTGRLIITDLAGNVVTVPFGPVVPNQLTSAGELRDANGGDVQPGDLLYATFTIANPGTADQQATGVTLDMPEGLTLVSSDPPATTTGRTLTWSLGLISAGDTHQIALALRVAPNSAGRDVALRPIITSALAPTQSVDVSPIAGSDGTVQPLTGALTSGVALVDTNGGVLLPGDTVAITLSVRAEERAFSGVEAGLTLPAWLTIGQAEQSTAQAALLGSPDPALWQVGDLAAGTTATLQIQASVAEAGLGQTLTVAPTLTSDQTGAVTVSAQQLGPVIDPRDTTGGGSTIRKRYLPLIQW